MSVVTQTPSHPDIATAETPLAGPIDPDAFRGNINTYVGGVEDKVELIQAFLEELQSAIGNGAISGGTISADVGHSVSIAAFKAFVGTVVETDDVTTVGGLNPSTTNYLWLRQDGTWGPTFTSTMPSADGHGEAFLWGTTTNDGSGVTAVSNVRDTFRLMKPLSQQRRIVKTGEVCHVGKEMQARLFGGLTVQGGLKIEGRLRIDP